MRAELAKLVDLSEDELPDNAVVRDTLDSLQMMTLTAYLQSRGIAVARFGELPHTVKEILTMMQQGSPIQVRLHPQPETLAPTLETRDYVLTPVDPEDTRFLHSMSIHPETAYRWRYRGNPPPIERFAQDLWHQVMVQFVVRLPNKEPIGHVVAYGADMAQRYVYAGAVFRADHTGSGIGAQATRTFLRYLFHTFPMRKIYVEIPGFNFAQIDSGEGTLFEVEGVMREHEFYAGRYWDRYLCAIYPRHLGLADPM